MTVAKLPAPRGHHRPRATSSSTSTTPCSCTITTSRPSPRKARRSARRSTAATAATAATARRQPAANPTPDDPNATKPADPIRTLQFPGTLVTCHAFREQGGGHQNQNDLLIGLANGEVVLTSLRALVGERNPVHRPGSTSGRRSTAPAGTGATSSTTSSATSSAKLPPGTLRFNTDGGGGFGGSERARLESPANASRCNPRGVVRQWRRRSARWVRHVPRRRQRVRVLRFARRVHGPVVPGHRWGPERAVGHAGGGAAWMARRWPTLARWHLGAGPMSCASFSPDGQYLAVAGGADGICRILDVTHWERPRLCGGSRATTGACEQCGGRGTVTTSSPGARATSSRFGRFPRDGTARRGRTATRAGGDVRVRGRARAGRRGPRSRQRPRRRSQRRGFK